MFFVICRSSGSPSTAGAGGRFGSALEARARNASDGVMSGADVEAVCREAAMLALRDQLAAAQAQGGLQNVPAEVVSRRRAHLVREPTGPSKVGPTWA